LQRVWYFEPLFYNPAQAEDFKKFLDKNFLNPKEESFRDGQTFI